MALSSISVRRKSGPVVRTASTQNFYLSERCYSAHMESPLHAHTKTYLIITLDGGYSSTFNTRTEEFKPWTVSYHQAGVSHSSRYAASGARVLYVELPMDQIKEFWGTSISHLAHFSLQGGLVEWLARQCYNEFTTYDSFSSVVLDGLIMQMLAHLLRRRLGSLQRLPTWLGNADETIRGHFTEPLALTEIAKRVKVHPVHLAREYRRYFNCTIGEQIRRLRIEYACEQLSTTNLSLADIALASGFSDQSHFTVRFKQQIGMAPSHYRKAVRMILFPRNSVSAAHEADA